MAKIQKLSSELIDQIAAGEVVDRPSSVVKELIENALDASPTKIEIKIIKGGHELMQVSDNGHGISKEDLRLAFTRHATSKIKNISDLNQITTLGFRGEALPSIASIAKVSTISSMGDNMGYKIEIHGSEEISFEPIAANLGSTFKVRQLFYNTPARRKFLKKPEAEQGNINKVLRYFMLLRSDVAFIVMSNEKIIYNLPIQNLTDRIKGIYGARYEKALLPIDMNKEPYTIKGYAGNLSLIKKRQGEQYLFLNGRYITNRLLNSAVYSAYQSIIKRGEYPFFVMFLEIPVELFDVNVHPAKLEVRFTNEWQVYHAVKSAITTVLQDILKVIPDYTHISSNANSIADSSEAIPFSNISGAIPYTNEAPPHREYSKNIDLDIKNKLDGILEKTQIGVVDIAHDELESTIEYIWQIHNKYLITEIKTGLVIIDQHVAHERILFEEAKGAIEGRGFKSQTILFPQTIKFLPEEYQILIDITHYLEKIGFRYREFGDNTIIIDGIPEGINWGNEHNTIREIIDQYIKSKNIDPTFIDEMAAIYACKSAIKAGDPLNHSERKNLIDQLFKTRHPYYCPHGRPIIINLPIDELDQRFERR